MNRSMMMGRAFPFCCIFISLSVAAQTRGGKVTIDPDGTYHVPAQNIPVTKYLSDSAKESMLTYMETEQHKGAVTRYPDGTLSLFAPYQDAQKRMFPLDTEDTKIAGVHVIIYTPKGGVPSSKREQVLIQVHGGAFRNCWEDCAPLETRPIAFGTRVRTISIDYHQGADHPFPAAQRDVEAVYRAILKTYKPQNIGMFGCSAGGRLTGMMQAWFIQRHLPTPGAIMIACAGLGGDRGDAEFTSAELGEGTLPAASKSTSDVMTRTGYFRTADPEDPMVQPIKSPAILAHFPPTLVVTGTRAHDMSSAVYAHTLLFKAGVDAHLYVVEGGRHGFWYDPRSPEAQEVYAVIVKWFDERLGHPIKPPVMDLGPIPATRSYPEPPPAGPEEPRQAKSIDIDPSGVMHIPAQTIPMTSYLSKEGTDSLVYYDTARRDASNGIADADGAKRLFAPYRARQASLYPLNIEDTKLGGVHVYVYTPREGVAAANRDRVLIELHGGACWNDCGHLETQPIAYLGRLKVVSIDYRENQFPGSEEDVAAVFSALLKTYKPQQIGIYGCSAGGILTARSMVYFQRHHLPNPGAIGILCNGAGSPHGRGDEEYTSAVLGEGLMPDENSNPPQAPGVDISDPMWAPVTSPAVLVKFPPTLLITGTRAMEYGTAVYTHAQLVKAGVPADLHVFEGGRHGFWYDPAPPESREVYRIIIDFFDKNLIGSRPRTAATRSTRLP